MSVTSSLADNTILRMRITDPALEQRISEVASWCSLHELVVDKPDTPDQARRRELLKQASRLLVTSKVYRPPWLQRWLPSGWRWTPALSLIDAAEPESLVTLGHQLRSSELTPPEQVGARCDERTEEIVNGVIRARSSLVESQLTREHCLSSDQLRGRLLLYVPRENLADGASQTASSISMIAPLGMCGFTIHTAR